MFEDNNGKNICNVKPIEIKVKDGKILANNFSSFNMKNFYKQYIETSHSDEIAMDYYSIVAGPRIINNLSKLKIENYSEIIEQLRCIICSDVYNETLSSKDCIHRFCKNCIYESMKQYINLNK